MEIDVLIEHAPWEALDLEAVAEAAAMATLREVSLDPNAATVSVLAADDTRIATLNADFRGKPTPTNVLSWPSVEQPPRAPGAMPDLPKIAPNGPPFELGDIALAYETCAREARDGGKPLEHHVTHLFVHGLMHCLGFDHETDKDAALMEGIETRILARLGVPDPY
jgi:probable rRNA maturation factor